MTSSNLREINAFKYIISILICKGIDQFVSSGETTGGLHRLNVGRFEKVQGFSPRPHLLQHRPTARLNQSRRPEKYVFNLQDSSRKSAFANLTTLLAHRRPHNLRKSKLPAN